MPHRCCFIVPASVLRKLADEAEGEARADLLDSLEHSERVRGRRDQSSVRAAASSKAVGGLRRTVFDAGGKRRLPGAIVRPEGAARCGDKVADSAYAAAGVAYDFFHKALGRRSVDGRGMRLDATVHYGRRYDNAFWDGAQMVYGDGDGRTFLCFADSIDVVAHEMTHGVVQHAVPGGGMGDEGEAGALGESVADVFGALTLQWHNGQSAKAASWLIGEGVMGAATGGGALRSMKAPGTAWRLDDQPADMAGFVPGGDPHTNSGIPNRAFHLAAMRSGGNAWESVGRVWYRGLAMLGPESTFAEAAEAFERAASLLYGPRGKVTKAVARGWREVKVT